MIVYIDTSVLLKLLITEPGSETATEIWQSADVLAAARIEYAEARAALAAAVRGGRITTDQFAEVKVELEALWAQLVVVEITEEFVELAGDLAEAEGLRVDDAIHLAAALTVSADIVATADLDLLNAATRRGIHAANPLS